MPNQREIPSTTHDVVICGGGLSGLLLARQLRQQLPELSVALIERQARPLPDACHKVGESSVECGCQYIESLGLEQYMLDRQLVKFGLRFFPGGGHLPLHQRTEIGPCAEPVVKSYQIDRGRFENDLRGFNEQDGVTMIEGCKVTTIELGTDGAEHRVDYEGARAGSIQAKWVVDATGRQALLRKRMKSTRGSPHTASAGWFRIEGRLGPNDMVPASETEWFERDGNDDRWRSTNHFMGPGYWAWLIPLSTGLTSVGLVIHEEIHDPKCIAGIDNTLAFLRQHEPHLAKALEGYEIKDFLCLRNYSHQVARAWSPDRWALVGEAGAFVDPLYSPGTDYIGFANMFTTELIRRDFAGEEWHAQATHLNYLYRAMVNGAIDLFRQAAPVYGHPSAMVTKVYWDNLSYWSFTCHLGKQGIYKLSPDDYRPYGVIGIRLAELGNFIQAWLRHWALLAPEDQDGKLWGAPHFPSVHIDAHMKVGNQMTLEETLEYMRMRLSQIEEAAVEIVLRTLQKVGPDIGRQLLQATDFGSWNIRIPAERIETELLRGQERRLRMSIMARDAERSMGRVNLHERAADALALLTHPQKGNEYRSFVTEELGDHLLNLLGGKHRAQALSTAAALGIADRLAETGPRTAAALADDLGCDAADLQSLMQLLAGLGYLKEPRPEHFELTAHGRQLCSEALGPLAAFIGAPEQWDPWSRLRDSMQRGDHQTAFERTLGKGLYEFLAGDPAASARYDEAIDAFTRYEARNLRTQLDLATANTVVDVGGGRGTLLLELLERWPHLHGVLFELPHVIRDARSRLQGAAGDRLELVEGDFFAAVPAGGDVYLLKHVLHNLDDERAEQLLARCAAAMDPKGRVVVIDAVLSPDNRPDLARLLDLEMRILTGGRERRKPELRRLFAAAGLKLTSVEPLTAASWLLVGTRKA